MIKNNNKHFKTSISGRMGAMYIGIILTDGRPKYKEAMIAEADVAKNSGIFLITIGVGRNIQVRCLLWSIS